MTAGNHQADADYFARKESRPFERPYGWAWLLKLAEELHGWGDPDARAWSDNLKPLEDVVVTRYLEFFPRQTDPIRTGVHPNTAFGLAFAHDYARAVFDARLKDLVEARARVYFGADADAPARWEPPEADFFSPSRVEADLMRRVLPPAEFRAWFAGFLPGATRGEPESMFVPATVADRADPQLVHLDGLNLSREGCLRGGAAALPDGDPSRAALASAADRHADASLEIVASGSMTTRGSARLNRPVKLGYEVCWNVWQVLDLARVVEAGRPPDSTRLDPKVTGVRPLRRLSDDHGKAGHFKHMHLVPVGQDAGHACASVTVRNSPKPDRVRPQLRPRNGSP